MGMKRLTTLDSHTRSKSSWLYEHKTHLVASLQVLHFMGKLLGLTVTLVLQLLHPPLDLLIELLQFLNVVFKFLQQPRRHKGGPEGH